MPWHPRVAPIAWSVGDPQDVCYPCPTAMTPLGLFPAYPPLSCRNHHPPKSPISRIPRYRLGQILPQRCHPFRPAQQSPRPAPGHPAVPGSRAPCHPQLRGDTRAGTCPTPPDWGVPPPWHSGTSPGPGKGSENSRAQRPLPRGTPRRQHPSRGLVGARGRLGGSQGGGEGRAGVLCDGGAMGAVRGRQGAVRVGVRRVLQRSGC